MTGSEGEEGRGETSPPAPSAPSAPSIEADASPSVPDHGTEADAPPDEEDHEGFAGASDHVGVGAERTPDGASSPEGAGAPPEVVPPPTTESVSPRSSEIEAPRAEPTVESPTKSRSEAPSRNRTGRGATETRSPKRPQKSSSPPANGERSVIARGVATAANDRLRSGTTTVKQSGGSASDLAAYLARVRARIASRQETYGGQRGRVSIRFDVVGDGDFVGLTVASGDRGPMAEAALRVVRRGAPAPPIPPSLGRDRIPVAVTIVFE